MGLRDIAPIIENDIRELVMGETWGHLAPKKNRTYHGEIVFGVGCYDEGDLNPTPLSCEFKGLNDSPWFYGAVHELLQDLPDKFRKVGHVYKWVGTFRNYSFSGTVNRLL